jgi:Flp pilus assembly CpaE family ATPase
VNTGDIKDIIETFDTSIVDLPYGNFSLANDEDQLDIIRNAMRISNKVVIVSSKDIRDNLLKEGLELIDECEVGKNRKSEFSRYVWVCNVVK